MYLGIEFGSTRIKSVLIDDKNYQPVAVGSHNWENRLENGIWTYHIPDVWTGLADSYADLARSYKKQCGKDLTDITAIGISGMMHGYIPINKNGDVLAKFRTWRNTNTGKAAGELRELFNYNIPLRWSISHLYQTVLEEEGHLNDLDFLTTLAGYVHFKLTGEKVLGVGDASGMFPIDCDTKTYKADMVAKFDNLIADRQYKWKLLDVLPAVQSAGESAGKLTAEGAKLLDPSGTLQPGIKFCPPEGDVGTGMVATNSVASLTGNVSAGTSIFAMVVLEKELKKVSPVLEPVTTPDCKPALEVHCNNGTSDIDGWVSMFAQIVSAHAGRKVAPEELYESLYQSALEAEADCGGLMACNYLSGEHNTGFEEGRPLFVRLPDASFDMPNFMRALLLSTMASLKLGMDILAEEKVKLSQILGHGGFFKTPGVAQRLMAGAFGVPVAVMETAGEGGAWGIALLAAYTDNSKNSLDDFLNKKVFANMPISKTEPNPKDSEGFKLFMKRYAACLKIERTAVDNFR